MENYCNVLHANSPWGESAAQYAYLKFMYWHRLFFVIEIIVNLENFTKAGGTVHSPII